MDEALVLDGNDDILASTFASSPKLQSRVKSAALSKSKSQHHKRNVFNANRKLGDDPRLPLTSKNAPQTRQTVLSPLAHGSKGDRKENDQATRARTSTMNSIHKGGKDKGSSTTTITPQKSTTVTTNPEPERRTWAAFSPHPATKETPKEHGRNDSQGKGYSNMQTLVLSQLPTSEQIFSRSVANGSTQAASITPMEYGAARASTQFVCESSLNGNRANEISRKRAAPCSSWNQTKRKQQRSQQRAFASRKDNPFGFFQHDPNDAESFLEGLSEANNAESSIIPEDELEAFRRNTVTRGPRVSQSRGIHRGKIGQKRRRNFPPSQKISNQELLRMKAAEQESYAASNTSQRAFTPMQSQPNYFAITAAEQLGPSHGFVQSYAMTPEYESGSVGRYSNLHGAENSFRSPTMEQRYPFQDSMVPLPQVSQIQELPQRKSLPYHQNEYFSSQMAPSGFVDQAGWQGCRDDHNEVCGPDGTSVMLNYCSPLVCHGLPQPSDYAGSGYETQIAPGAAPGLGLPNAEMQSVWTDKEAEESSQVISPPNVEQDSGDHYFNDAFF
jgi:hypothetical protein